ASGSFERAALTGTYSASGQLEYSYAGVTQGEAVTGGFSSFYSAQQGSQQAEWSLGAWSAPGQTQPPLTLMVFGAGSGLDPIGCSLSLFRAACMASRPSPTHSR
ncbi:MAG: hypothetical protein ACYDB7_14580, partial [Mycobacteriales bacterium]